MEMHNLLNAKNRQELREWLTLNHDNERECWVITKRGKPCDDTHFWYIDAVEEALCFGWIDSTQKRLNGGRTAQRFTPRKRNSTWTELNKERCRKLIRNEQMTDAGKSVLPDLDIKNFTIDSDVLAQLQADKIVWQNFCQFHPLYQRVRIGNIQNYKEKNPMLYQSRLQKFIDFTRQNKMFGEWNDYGRLTE